MWEASRIVSNNSGPQDFDDFVAYLLDRIAQAGAGQNQEVLIGQCQLLRSLNDQVLQIGSGLNQSISSSDRLLQEIIEIIMRMDNTIL